MGPRIIPARAGFTDSTSRQYQARTDHPRSRGVYASFTLLTAIWNGSSPLARGLRDLRCPPWNGPRIIPARAGFTHSIPVTHRSSSDHPRSRGVYVDSAMERGEQSGSSPLARGLPRHVDIEPVLGGIIPARAGFTPAASRTGRHGSDHPRSRGVYACHMSECAVGCGSSPLARGLR